MASSIEKIAPFTLSDVGRVPLPRGPRGGPFSGRPLASPDITRTAGIRVEDTLTRSS